MIKNKSRRKIKAIFGKKRIFGVIFLLILLFAVFRSGILLKTASFISPIPSVLSGKLGIIASSSYSQLETVLKNKNIPYESIELESSFFKVKLKNGEEVLFDSKKPFNSQASSLQLLLSHFTIEGKGFEKIDFRYDKPIVVFKQ